MHLSVYVADFAKMQKALTITDVLYHSFPPADHQTLGRKGIIQKPPGDKQSRDLKFLSLDAHTSPGVCYALETISSQLKQSGTWT